MFFSPDALRTSSGSLKLALNGSKSLSKPKLDPEKERPLRSVLGAAPSSSSRALNESSESREDLERNGDCSCSENSRGSREILGAKLINGRDFTGLTTRPWTFLLLGYPMFIIFFSVDILIIYKWLSLAKPTRDTGFVYCACRQMRCTGGSYERASSTTITPDRAAQSVLSSS
jgi:hypothetical protein